MHSLTKWKIIFCEIACLHPGKACAWSWHIILVYGNIVRETHGLKNVWFYERPPTETYMSCIASAAGASEENFEVFVPSSLLLRWGFWELCCTAPRGHSRQLYHEDDQCLQFKNGNTSHRKPLFAASRFKAINMFFWTRMNSQARIIYGRSLNNSKVYIKNDSAQNAFAHDCLFFGSNKNGLF